jgi:hypothetical protein
MAEREGERDVFARLESFDEKRLNEPLSNFVRVVVRARVRV